MTNIGYDPSGLKLRQAVTGTLRHGRCRRYSLVRVVARVKPGSTDAACVLGGAYPRRMPSEQG